MTEQASLREQIIRPSVEEIHASIPHKGVRDLINDEDWTLNLEKDVG